MFFATTSSAPFETLREAIQSYPNWRLIFLDGWFLGWINNEAKTGDRDFISLWQRYQENPEEMIYSNIGDGLYRVESRPNIMHVDKNLLLAQLKENPIQQKLHMISIKESQYELSHILFYKNSPLLPMFTQGVINLRETGLERQLFLKWFGEWSEVNGSVSSEVTILTLGQMVLIFALMSAMFAIVLIILCGEFYFNRFFNKVILHWPWTKMKWGTIQQK